MGEVVFWTIIGTIITIPIVNPMLGLLVGGQKQYLNALVVPPVHFSSSTPLALYYMDSQGSYASNEITINRNAPLIFVAGYFN